MRSSIFSFTNIALLSVYDTSLNTHPCIPPKGDLKVPCYTHFNIFGHDLGQQSSFALLIIQICRVEGGRSSSKVNTLSA